MQPENWIPEKERPSFFTTDLPENSRTFMLQVRKQPDGQLWGSIHNLYLEQPQIFSGLADAVLQIDAMMDGLDNPQACTEHRSFFSSEKEMKNDTAAQREAYYQWLHKGKKVVQQYWTEQSLQPDSCGSQTFYIHVRFRQHSSWQGEVMWKQGKKKTSFRSVLELLHLLQSAFAEQRQKPVKDKRSE